MPRVANGGRHGERLHKGICGGILARQPRGVPCGRRPSLAHRGRVAGKPLGADAERCRRRVAQHRTRAADGRVPRVARFPRGKEFGSGCIHARAVEQGEARQHGGRAVGVGGCGLLEQRHRHRRIHLAHLLELARRRLSLERLERRTAHRRRLTPRARTAQL